MYNEYNSLTSRHKIILAGMALKSTLYPTMALAAWQLCVIWLTSVAYWPPTRPSCEKKKCACVNKRCIRSKISGDQGQPWLSRNWIECEIVTLAGSRWASNYYITPATSNYYITPAFSLQLTWTKVQVSWSENAGMGTISLQRLGPPRPPVEQPRRTARKGCDSQKRGGQYVAVFVRSPTPSHTQPFQ